MEYLLFIIHRSRSRTTHSSVASSDLAWLLCTGYLPREGGFPQQPGVTGAESSRDIPAAGHVLWAVHRHY